MTSPRQQSVQQVEIPLWRQHGQGQQGEGIKVGITAGLAALSQSESINKFSSQGRRWILLSSGSSLQARN